MERLKMAHVVWGGRVFHAAGLRTTEPTGVHCYPPMRLLCDVRYRRSVWRYARAMRCPAAKPISIGADGAITCVKCEIGELCYPPTRSLRYQPTRLLCGVRYRRSKRGYRPTLTFGMALPGGLGTGRQAATCGIEAWDTSKVSKSGAFEGVT
eukprot:2378158-Rhodomonas_salina.1